jgi:hypothetical protein
VFLATAMGFSLLNDFTMPANNRLLVLQNRWSLIWRDAMRTMLYRYSNVFKHCMGKFAKVTTIRRCFYGIR